MRVTRTRDEARRTTRYELEVPDVDMVRVMLDRWDRLLLDECSGPDASVADVLLGLQTVAFRLEQQSKGEVA